MNDLPPPPLPNDVDLSGYEYMPLHGHKLFGSDFNATCTDAEWRAGVTLWWAAWNQVPAGSLPDDDIALCRLADLGRDVKTWRKLRANALRGFYLCSDGRLYHQRLCEWAMEAWRRRVADRDRKRKAREKKDGQNADAVNNSGTRGADKGAVSAGQDADVLRGEAKRSEANKLKEESTATAEHVAARPEPPAGPDRDAIAIVAIADDEFRSIFGETTRPWPAPLDQTTARQWLDAGATPDLIRSVASAQAAKLLAKGKSCPVSLKFIDRDVRDAIAEVPKKPSFLNQPKPEPWERKGNFVFWEDVVRGFIARPDRGWPANMGPPPGAEGFIGPAALDEMYRKATAGAA